MCLLLSHQLVAEQWARFYRSCRLQELEKIEKIHLPEMQNGFVIKTEHGEFKVTNEKLINKISKHVSRYVDSQKLKEGK